MRIVETVDEMRDVRAALPGPVCLMATLGGMHAGHEALLRRAREEGASLVASLFLNPTQFDDASDLEAYPTDAAADLEIFRRHGVDVVFRPTVPEMYPAGAATAVDCGPVGAVLEGAHRPGHFRGVATVVVKILTVVRPDVCVWGAKDAQQNVVIRQVTRDLLMTGQHLVVPTVRADDGLALSSRNERLGGADRVAAARLFAGLEAARAGWRGGERDSGHLCALVRATVADEPRVRLEYVEVVDGESFDTRPVASEGDLVVLAASVGPVRLIDNIRID